MNRFLAKSRFLMLILSLPLLLGASTKMNFDISGVQGRLLTNIQARLTELAQTKPLAQETDVELRLEIEKAMQPYGYFRPQINLNRAAQRISINPGPRMLVTSLNIHLKGEGAENAELKKALSELPLRPGKPLNSAKYEKAKQNLLSAAERQGYVHANFEKSEIIIDIASYTAKISLLLDTGPQYYFGQVQFDPTYISPDLLHRFVPFQYGQPYSADKILTLNAQLANSGYFRSVSVKPQTNSSSRYIPVDVHLHRASRINYSLGAGYGTDTGVRGRAGLHIVPVNRAGDKFNLVALGSFNQSALQAQYLIPGKNPVTDQYNINANLSALNYNVGYSNAVLVAFAQQHTVPKFQRILSINGLYENYHYTNKPREEKKTIFPKGTFTWLTNRDKLFNPTGYSLTVNGLGATRAFLSDENFAQASINAKAAVNLRSIGTRFYFHTIQGVTLINRIDQLPLSLALLLGGAENLKGYNYNSIGPGKYLTYGGLEIQKETIKNWYLVGFFDSGDVYRPNPKFTKYDLGIGLMWVSPVGPIKIGIAQGINNRFGREDRSPKFFVNMGPDL